MAHGNLLFPNPLAQLFIRKRDRSGRSLWRLLLKDPAHVAQEPGGTGEQGWPPKVIHVVKEILSILAALRRRQREPADGGVPVLRNLLAQQIELAQGILGVLVPPFSGGGQPADALGGIL